MQVAGWTPAHYWKPGEVRNTGLLPRTFYEKLKLKLASEARVYQELGRNTDHVE
jgi:hypothetical protein